MAEIKRGRGRPKSDPKVLTDKQRKIVDNYLGPARLSKVEALRMAGVGSPKSNVVRYFSQPALAKYLRQRQKAIRRRYKITHDRIMDELARVAFSSCLDFAIINPKDGLIEVDFRHADFAQLAALGEVRVDSYRSKTGKRGKVVRVKLHNKLQALDLLVRHSGLSRDKQKVEVEGRVNVADALLAARRRSEPRG